MARRKQQRTGFRGFDRPESNFFRMPNSWTDITAEIDSIAELKVVEYILRHTWGYQEYGIKKHITIEEFVNGRRRQDGSRMDRGTGLSERAVYDGLRKAVENGLVEEEIDDSDRGRVRKFYSLRMREEVATEEQPQSLQPGVQSLHPPLQTLHPGPQSLQGRGAGFAPRTEKDTLERHLDPSKFEGFHDQSELTRKRPTERQRRVDRDPHGSERTQDEERRGGMSSLRGVIERRRAAGPKVPRRRGRPPGAVEEREHVAAFLEDFAVELGDEAPLASTITRAINVFKAAGVPEARWDDLLYQARRRTQEASAQITKQAGEGSGLRRKNKMPYFFGVLEQLAGLRNGADAEPEAVEQAS